MKSFTFQPIGFIETPHKESQGTPIQPAAARETLGKVILHEPHTPGLQDLEGFSHIVLIYVFDRSGPARLTVKPFLDTEPHGVFATRAPARPNPIGISVVRLLNIDGHILTIQGVDMLDQTPLLDIKPQIPPFENGTADRFGWLEKNLKNLDQTRDDGRFINS